MRDVAGWCGWIAAESIYEYALLMHTLKAGLYCRSLMSRMYFIMSVYFVTLMVIDRKKKFQLD